MEFTGPYIRTYTGIDFYYLCPTVEMIDLRDIAHALALTCRFAGHVDFFYSVNQHCVLVSYVCPKEYALYGLLHDAAEAYLMDMPTPLKELIPEYTIIEKRIMFVIASKFGLDMEPFSLIKTADKQLLATEMRDLLGIAKPHIEFNLEEKPLIDTIVPWSWESSEERFLRRYKQLTRKS